MQTGDFVTTKSGHQWTVGYFTVHLPKVEGGEPGRYFFLLRVVETPDGPTIIYDLVHEDEIVLHSEFEIDPCDVFLFGDDMLSVGKRGVRGLNSALISMKDDEGRYRGFWAWQVSLVALQGMEKPLHLASTPMRQASAEEV